MEKPLSTTFSNFFLNWEKVLPLCPDSNIYKQLFTAKYMPYLPTEEELIIEIECQKELLKIQYGDEK